MELTQHNGKRKGPYPTFSDDSDSEEELITRSRRNGKSATNQGILDHEGDDIEVGPDDQTQLSSAIQHKNSPC